MTIVVVVVTLVVLVGGTRFAGARTAENGCTNEASRQGYSTVSGYRWSWSPLGTECVFDGEVSVTRLFW